VEGNVTKVKKLLREGAKVNQLFKTQSEYGESYQRSAITALVLTLVSCVYRNITPRSMSRLLQLNPWETKMNESTKAELAKILINAGAKPDMADTHRWHNSALHYVQSARVMCILLSAYPLPVIDCLNLLNQTPLHTQAYMGEATSCQLLIDAKANVHAVDKSGNTPLHIAVQCGHDNVVTTLLMAKADALEIKNNEGYNAIHMKRASFAKQNDVDRCHDVMRTYLENAGLVCFTRPVI